MLAVLVTGDVDLAEALFFGPAPTGLFYQKIKYFMEIIHNLITEPFSE
jgi:hypothetical protein